MARELQPWSPLHEMARFRRDFEDLFEHFFAPWKVREAAPSVESFIEGDNLVVRADLPGVDPNKVEVSVTGNILTIKGSREQKREEKGRHFMHRELSYGSFERSLTLPDGVKADAIKAAYKDGVLELTMPAPKGLSVRKVPIQIEAAGGAKEEKKK